MHVLLVQSCKCRVFRATHLENRQSGNDGVLQTNGMQSHLSLAQFSCLMVVTVLVPTARSQNSLVHPFCLAVEAAFAPTACSRGSLAHTSCLAVGTALAWAWAM